MRRILWTAVVTLAMLLPGHSFADKKKKKDEDFTQVIPLPRDPPAAIAAQTSHLEFVVSPLTSKGLLTPQLREGLKAILPKNKGQIVRLRAFVAGTGDLRTVQRLVIEVLTEKKLDLPVFSVIQVGGLPELGAQVVLEATIAERKTVNPNGLAFFSGQAAPKPEKSLGQLQTAVKAAGLGGSDVARVTCFMSSLDGVGSFRTSLAAAFPQAALNLVQLQRAAVEELTECEAVGRLNAPAAGGIRMLNPEGLTKSPNYSQIALISTPKVLFTGEQLAFQSQESDVRLAFDRLGKTLEGGGASYKDVVMMHTYSLGRSITERIRAVRFDYLDKTRPPASTLLQFEGLPSMDASFGLDVIAALAK